MKTLFTHSYWFWIISKIILAILLLISTISILGMERLKTDELLINTVGLIEAVLLIITLFYDFSSGSKSEILKILTGSILIVFGIGLFVILLTVLKDERSSIYFLGYPFAIWMIMIGIFEVLRIQKPNTKNG